MHTWNLAARAGAWSARRWKTATVGWIVVMAAAIAAGSMVGNAPADRRGAGERASPRAAPRCSSAPASSPPPARACSSSRRRSPPGGRRSAAAVSDVSELRRCADVAGRAAQRDGLEGRPLGARHVRRRRATPDTADTRIQPVLDAVGRRPARAPGLHPRRGRATRAGTRPRTRSINQDLQPRRDAARCRSRSRSCSSPSARSSRRGCPCCSPSRPCSRTIGLGALVSHVVHASGTTSSVDRADGDGGRRRLLALLPQARAGGARPRPRRRATRCTPRRRTSGRAVLVSGLTVVVACAGMLLSGSSDFVSIGVGAIARRARRDARLADACCPRCSAGSGTASTAASSPCSPPRSLRRSGSSGSTRAARAAPRAAHAAPAAEGRRAASRGSGASCCGPRFASRAWRRSPRVAVARRRSPCRRSACTRRIRASTRFPPSLADREGVPRDRARVPGHAEPGGGRRRRRRTSPRRPSAAGIADSRAAGARDRADARADPRRREPGAHGRAHRRAARRQRRRRASVAALQALALAGVPATLGSVPGRRGRRHRRDRRQLRLQPRRSTRHDAARLRRSCCASRSGCSCSPFRSLVVPLTAIALNLLSVGAAYGVLVWIFQDGHLQGLLGFHSNGAVVTWLPLFLFTVLFGLSMDYHVFIVSRIKELVDRGVPTDRGGRAWDPHDRLDGDERRGGDGRRVRDLRLTADARPQAARRRARRRGAASMRRSSAVCSCRRR